jgi:N-methylhydantoinase A
MRTSELLFARFRRFRRITKVTKRQSARKKPSIAEASMYKIGIDIGSTFTDVYIVDANGHTHTAKVSTNHQDLEATFSAATAASAELLGISVEEFMQQCDLMVNATTVATNAVVMRKGAKVGVLTTAGFKDVLFIGRIVQKVAGLSQDELRDFFKLTKADPIVPRTLVEEISERIDAKGNVLCAIDPERARPVIQRLLDKGVEAIAISLVYAFKNPAHEQQLKALVQTMAPHVPVTISSEISLRAGEYERIATTAVNAYVTPRVNAYIEGIDRGLKSKGLRHDSLIMQSFGGVGLPQFIRAKAISCLASGPVAGVIGARALGQTLGYDNLLCTDIGGASFDVGMIHNGRPKLQHEPVVSKYNLQLSIVDVVSIGAGGGSIAWIDDVGALKVGPVSAQSVPGPACFDRGGELPTVTDADLLLGYLNPGYFAGGAIRLDKDKALASIQTLSRRLGLDEIETAKGIFDIMNAQCADLIRMYTIKSGFDPRDFAVLAYGGAGPTHAAWYARDLGPKKLIISPHSGVFSASGLLASDILNMYELSDPMTLPVDPERMQKNFDHLEYKAHKEFEAAGVEHANRIIQRAVNMRFSTQGRTLAVPVAAHIDAAEAQALQQRFIDLYAQTYGADAVHVGAPIEVSSYSVEMLARLRRIELPKYALGKSDASAALKGHREAFFQNSFVSTPVYDMALLKSGMELKGPAIIEDRLTTAVIDAGQVGVVDAYLNIQIAV